MITVRPVGGAKKLLGGGDIRAESGITVSALLEKLQGMAPELDPANVLVAINGADSSALQGRDTVLRDGDIASIIPVIHGGACSIMIRVAGRNVLAAGARSPDLDSLRARHPGLAIQAVSDRFILDRYHLERILYLSLSSARRGCMLSRRMETDLLMRLALTNQISAAIGDAGASGPSVVVAIGPRRGLERLRAELRGQALPIFSRDNSAFLARRFKITKRHLDSISSRRPLADALAERAAIL